MQSSVCRVLVLAALAFGTAQAASANAGVTPVQKVLDLLDGMIAKGKKEKHAEQVQFAAYKQFCDDTTAQKQKSIKDANEQIDVLKADIQKFNSDAATLTEQIAGDQADISTWEGDSKASTKVREIENAEYLATHKDYSESITALEEGIATLKKQAHDVKQAAAASLAEDPETDENLAESAPEAAAHEFHSQGLLDMLA